MPVSQNHHLVEAYRDYMQALASRRAGLLGNASVQRERLRTLYRILAGKPWG